MAFFAPGLRCALFPDWETLPYDSFSPHQDLISERLATLWRINQRDKEHGADVVLVPATTALYRLAPPSFLAGYTFEFKRDRKSTRLNSSHLVISYAVFCLKKKKNKQSPIRYTIQRESLADPLPAVVTAFGVSHRDVGITRIYCCLHVLAGASFCCTTYLQN